MIFLAAVARLFHHGKGLFASRSRIHHDAGVFHEKLNASADILIVIHCQDPGYFVFLPELFIILDIRNAQLKIHPEKAAFVHFAKYFYGAAHEFHNVLCDGHAKPGSLHLVRGAVFRPGKGLKDSL